MPSTHDVSTLVADGALDRPDILAVVERDTRFEKAHVERYLVGFEPPAKSRFQRLWEGHGLPTLRLDLRKRLVLEVLPRQREDAHQVRGMQEAWR